MQGTTSQGEIRSIKKKKEIVLASYFVWIQFFILFFSKKIET
jgi:hypothetical protein